MELCVVVGGFGGVLFPGPLLLPVCVRALLDETQEERAEIVKVAVLFVIAVRRGGGKGEQKKTTTKGQTKIPFLGSISQHPKKNLEEKGELGVNK